MRFCIIIRSYQGNNADDWRHEMNANIQAAKTFGAIAFASGIKCAPCLDGNMMDMLKGRMVGDNRSTKEMKAWVSGWIQASLAA